jgi:hypothetical protein
MAGCTTTIPGPHSGGIQQTDGTEKELVPYEKKDVDPTVWRKESQFGESFGLHSTLYDVFYFLKVLQKL